VIFLGFLGFAIAFFAAGANPYWLVAGTATGGVMGFIIGRNLDNSSLKNKN
jgi:hypothetical protein